MQALVSIPLPPNDRDDLPTAAEYSTTVRDEARAAAAKLVQIQGLSKHFGAFKALYDVSFTIMANELFTLLGPSGCGKTTLLRLLAGFEHPTEGVILLDGKHVAEDPPHKRPVNTVFQSYALFPHLTVAQNVAFGLERQGMCAAAVVERVAAMLKLVRLDHVAGRRPQQLSGGQQQRVALARALAPQPRLLLLDEPLSALDLKLRRGMQAELKRIQREAGITFVLVTHDQEEALSMSDRIAVMDAGRVLQIGSPSEIYERPNCRFVADFVGEANVLPGALVGLDAPFAAIRPERVLIAQGLAEIRERTLSGRLREMTYMGVKTACVIALADGAHLRVERGDLPSGLAIGQGVTCILPADALLPLGE